MVKSFFSAVLTVFTFLTAFSEGSKNLTPNSSGGVATGTNDFVGILEHSSGISGNFLQADAPANERVFIRIRAGETLYWGLRRIENGDGDTNQDLTVILYENDGTIATSWTLTDDDGSTTSSTFDAQAGVISSYAAVAAGPSAVVGGTGYNALSYTNTTGSDQDFYIAFVQFDGGSTNAADDVNARSWYDIWDFSVYSGTEEKPGRMYTQKWGFTASDFGNLLSTEFQLYARIPSTVGGVDAGNYIKEIDLSGLDPFSFNLYANSLGADPAIEGTTDFRLLRQSQDTETALFEYNIFINNPDIDEYPTTTLPSVEIANAVFSCNGNGGGQATIYFETNQTGQVAILIDLNGQSGYQDGTSDIIIEREIGTEGAYAVSWNGLDGLGNTVASGTQITVSGRFTSGPLHVPLWDVEDSPTGILMRDVRPATSFDLIYWDDSNIFTGADPEVQFSGTNINTHTWTSGDDDLVNTWSFGYYQINTQVVDFVYSCDTDGDGVSDEQDDDSDNDGISDFQEGNPKTDSDADGIPDYLDPDAAGFVDENKDGVDDRFDADQDGIPNALDLDSDNDGIPDIIEAGLTDADNDGRLDAITDVDGNGQDDATQTETTQIATFADECQTVDDPTHNISFAVTTTDASDDAILSFSITGDYGVQAGETFTLTGEGAVDLGTYDYTDSDNLSGDDCVALGYTVLIPQANWNTFNDDGTVSITLTTGGGVDNICAGGTSSCLANTQVYFTANTGGGTPISLPNTDGDGAVNYLDLDSDNDGLVDAFEAGGTAGANGQIANFIDADGNGRNDTQDIGALPLTDTDADGTLPNYLDLDSDNDGILDNVEGQASNAFIATAAGDTDGNGLLDVYDPNNGGTLLTPVDTDGDGDDDYFDTDADGDGVVDLIEGHDANSNGFADWDTDNDNVLEAGDFANFNNDDDGDGIWNVFDPDNGGTTAPVQNSDGADFADFQDTDDDNDGNLTAGEDVNNNNDWTDDFTQGQGSSVVGTTAPDYLFRGDYDGDGLFDANDADSDNDGILDIDEDGGEAINPSEDADSDGIPNYRDADISGSLADNTDANGDGIYDVYDADLDGIPDFLDLDSDNDGILDAIEANNGAVPNGLDTNTGQFTLNDPDQDGLMNFVDNNPSGAGGSSVLSNADNDSDGINDYLDIDSDGDGITDFSEGIAPGSSLAFSGNDSDGDGIDDSFDPDNGGTLIVPVNTDAQDNPDYLDDDSDNDNITDIVEGDDGNNDGFGEWDANQNGLTDDAGFGVDSDGDGLVDAFDNVTLGSGTNATGSNTDLQNTDGTDNKDFRDSDDDNDGDLTADEDINANGNYADDRTDGQGGANIPDYLFYGDFDGDGIADALDGDSDNDGILDADEDNGEAVDPSGDEDGDGIPNFRDTDDPAVTGVLTSTADSNGDGIYDVYDSDLDGIPDFRDLDSDNDGLPDVIEAGGTDANGDGVLDNVTDTDGDGISNQVDADNGGTPLFVADHDGDGLRDAIDLDSDGDGLTDLIEAGGTDANGDGKLDDLTDTDGDGFGDLHDTDNGGTSLARPDSDSDGVRDYLDVDSDNDGITDAVENGGADTDGNGKVDGFNTDTDGDGLSDSVDPDNGGTPIGNVDTDGDGIPNNRDLDSDNDGYPDILEGGGTDSDNDGVVDSLLDTDSDGIPDAVDVDQTGGTDSDGDGIDDTADTDFLGGTDTDGDGIPDSADVDQTGGTDTDGDGIDDNADVDQTGGSDIDGDGIDDVDDPDKDGDGIENGFDTDKDGDGLADAIENNPYSIVDTDGDGQKNFADVDADNDGIPDVVEFGLTADAGTGQINGFTDADSDGWNDAQDGSQGGTAIVLTDSDNVSDPNNIPNYLDLDSDNDGIVDNIEAQTKATYIAPSGIDSDNDGLDDAYDPNNGGTLITPVNTDTADNPDYLDDDSDNDTVPDQIEGNNGGRGQFADWDADNDGNFDDTGFNSDVDADGILDIFDDFVGIGTNQVTGSNAAVQDTDIDGTWDFQDTDDDNDGTLTSAEDNNGNSDPTDDFNQGGTPIPDYLFDNPDSDGDGVGDANDDDADNDGLSNADEDGGTGVDPGGDIDGDGILNYEDSDMDGDGTPNVSDGDANGDGTTDAFDLTDANGDGIIDEFDHDLDGVPDMIDRDSDNDGIADVVEFGLADSDEDGTLDGTLTTDVNGNGMEDSIDPSCVPTPTNFTGNATNDDSSSNIPDPEDAIGAIDDNFALFDAVNDELIMDMGLTIPDGETISIRVASTGNGNTMTVEQGTSGAGPFSNLQSFAQGGDATREDDLYVLNADARFVRIIMTVENGGVLGVDALSYDFTQNVNPCGGTTGVAITVPDTDSDGVPNYQDLDSDNDGITDNREGQATSAYVAPVAGDTDGDGILDVYDEDISAGNAIAPVNSDGADVADYLDTDSDNDGVIDRIEGFDANSDGFADWDTDGDNDITDETGYNIDTDGDGLWNIYDTDNGGFANFANIDASNQALQNTDGADEADHRDTDDDNDGNLTSAEDDNSNGDWTDDFTQNGGTIPDYLYASDNDGDGILDEVDYDSDNDGILNADELGANLPAPFGDDDRDGIYNYLDSDLSGFIDVNSDGVDDRYDTDRDGIPNFFDLDSDDDGISDIIEAGNPDVDNDGRIDSFDDSADSNGYDDSFTLTGGTIVDQNGSGNSANATGLPDDTDADINGAGEYLTLDLGNSYPVGTAVAFVLRKPNGADGSISFQLGHSTASGGTYTNSPAVTPPNSATFSSYYLVLDAAAQFVKIELTARSGGRIEVDGIYFNATPPSDTDGDSFRNFLDIDSDDDGIPDNIEGQAVYTAISGNDTDNDGLDDAYDGNNGGTTITPANTDSNGNADYIDTDSDDDGVPDVIEAFDANQNGFGDWDTNGDNIVTTEANYGTDNDNDGLRLIFDSFSGRGISNVSGSNAALQDTDGDGTPDYRDTDDDEDGILTSAEDNNSNGDWTDDKTEGGGATPDYLFFADFDEDGVADAGDFDSDNDGIPNANEYDGALPAPFADADADGTPNWNDPIPANDTNNDGVDDRYDFDLDGTPNFFDLDSDNDGIPDAVEANNGSLPANMDANGQYPAAYALANDADGDGVVDDVDLTEGGSLLANPNSDGNGRSDFLDRDSDDDGIPDIIEAGGVDVDNDGIIDSFDDTDGDGLSNSVDPDNGGTALGYPDTDNDGLADYRDVDSDNDGFADIVEAGSTDADADGRADNVTDTDGDGWADIFDSDNSGTALPVTDTDNDGNPNYRDLDSDNDLMPDAIEANDGVIPANMTSEGQFSALTDTDGDGFHDDRDGTDGGTAYNPTNTDGNGPADYLDIDSDNDGIPDVIENGGADANGDGRIDSFVDTDDDGLHDPVDSDNGGTAAVTTSDKDSDGIPNYQDADSDNDGIADIIEGGGTDGGNDGVTDTLTDTDGDGWVDTYDQTNGGTALPVPDTDGDGWRNFLDLDSDNDGIVDAIEANDGLNLPAGMDDNGQYTALSDGDGDGLHDDVDGTNGGTALPIPNTDSPADALPDYIDLDSDNDGASDLIEGFDDNEDGDVGADLIDRAATYETANGTPGHYPTTDSDMDGIPDWLEDDDMDGVPNFTDPGNSAYRDTDGDGIVDLFDPTQNGTRYADPSAPDNDNDSTPNHLDADDEVTLPVEMTFFTGEFEQGKVKLKWQTAVEINNDFFEVYKSTDGKEFSMIGKVDGNGNTNQIIDYQFIDESPVDGINYYRLRQVDFDGQFEISAIVKVVADLSDFQLDVYPNPVSNQLSVQFNSSSTEVRLKLIDPRGVILRDLSGNVFGTNPVNIDVRSVEEGLYYLHLYINGKTVVRKIVIKH